MLYLQRCRSRKSHHHPCQLYVTKSKIDGNVLTSKQPSIPLACGETDRQGLPPETVHGRGSRKQPCCRSHCLNFSPQSCDSHLSPTASAAPGTQGLSLSSRVESSRASTQQYSASSFMLAQLSVNFSVCKTVKHIEIRRLPTHPSRTKRTMLSSTPFPKSWGEKKVFWDVRI